MVCQLASGSMSCLLNIVLLQDSLPFSKSNRGAPYLQEACRSDFSIIASAAMPADAESALSFKVSPYLATCFQFPLRTFQTGQGTIITESCRWRFWQPQGCQVAITACLFKAMQAKAPDAASGTSCSRPCWLTPWEYTKDSATMASSASEAPQMSFILWACKCSRFVMSL